MLRNDPEQRSNLLRSGSLTSRIPVLLHNSSVVWQEISSEGVLEYLVVNRVVVKRVLFKWFQLRQVHGPNKLVK